MKDKKSRAELREGGGAKTGAAPRKGVAPKEEGVAPREGTATPPPYEKKTSTKQNVNFIYLNCHSMLYLLGSSVT